MDQPIWNFEQEPYGKSPDETGINLRAYLDRMDDVKMRQYNAQWSEAELIEWDGNFRDDGALMLICSERDVDAEEFRQELEACLSYRNRVRG